MINTTADPAGSNSVSAGNVLFNMIRFAKIIPLAGLGGLALGLLALPALAAQPVAVPANRPLYFEANRGQANVPAQFIARGYNYQFLISPTEAQIVLRKATVESVAVRMQFVDANAQAQIRGDAELPGKINYLTGNDPAQWRVGVAMFAKVRVGELYPGVNLVYYGNQQQLEYDFDIAPGTNPDVIAIHFDGTDKISINPQGELILGLAGGEIRQPKPVIYQTIGGTRKEIAGDYRLVDTHTVAFTIGQYDRNQPLVIDPLLSYSTYFGGSAGDTAWAVALDTNGFIYMAGQTFSKQYSTNAALATSGAFQTNFAGGKLTGDAFVAKFNNSGTSLIYLTYLGGSADDGAFGVAVDSAGNAYVTGFTDSPDFPVTNSIPGGVPGLPNSTNISGILDKSFGYYPIDAFVTELDSSGSNLVYSTYLGGSSMDCGMGIAVDTAGAAYVTGFTYSSNFPTVNALQNKLACTNSFYFNANAFIAKIGPGGTNLVYSTYFGGTNFDEGKGIAVDINEFVYVTGFTASTNFPTTNAVVQQLVWTNVVINHLTSITNYISITNHILNGYLLNGSTNKTSSYDAFVAKFNPIDPTTGTKLVYSTFLGGTNSDVANGIAVDTNGAAYVTGWTISTNFPNTVGTNMAGLHSFVATNTSLGVLATNVFLTKITNAIGTTNVGIAWSAVFGGRGVDIGYGVAVDPAGSNVFVTGSTSSTNFPTYNVPGYLRATNSGKSDAFVIAFGATGSNLLYSTYLGGKENDFGYGIAVDMNDVAYVVGQTLSTNFPTLNAGQPLRNGTNDAFLTMIMLTVPPPTITIQPGDQAVAVGSNATFSVYGNVTGPQPFFYQWQNGPNLVTVTNVLDGTTNVVTVTNLVTANVTNVLDGITNVVTVTNLMIGENISGATNYTLTITNAQMTNSDFYYQVIVTNYGGSVTSSVALLTVTNIPPAITVPPASQTNGVGTTVTLAVTAIGTPPLKYQWWDGTNLVKNGGQISGATSNVLTISNVQLTNDGIYTIVVTNALYGGSATTNASLTVQSSPVIVLQPTPTNQVMAVGSNATFTVTAIGTVPLHYQWWDGTTKLVNGTNLVNGAKVITSGATTTNLTLSNVQTNNGGSYSVTVTNVTGSVTSSPAFLQVTNIPPAIQVPPTSQTNGVGTTVNLTITATGTAPLSYQWWVNGTNLVKNGGHFSGATSNVLTISDVQLTNGGIYTVVVTNTIYGGSATTNAILTVLSSPVIFTQPVSQTNAVGSTATFTVAAIGTVPLHYQWWFNGTTKLVNGTNLVNGAKVITSGATTTNLTIIKAQTTNNGNYTVIVTNIAGSVTSSNAVLMVTNILPSVTGPTNQTVVVGTTVTLAVTATGTVPLSYQWQMNGTNLVNSGHNGQISGATSSALIIKNAQTTNSGSYTVIVTNFGGSVTSSVAILTVASSPMILVQPMSQVVTVGTSVTNAVTAIGTAPLHYQWWVNGTNLVKNGGGISGATTSKLIISDVQTTNSGSYTVIVTNTAGSVISSNAVLTVVRLMVVAWGDNDYGQTNVPVDATNVMAIAGGGFHSLALQTNGTVVAWGADNDGQTNVPADLTNVVAIAAGYVHSLALQANGTVAGWGAGTNNTGSFPEYGQVMIPADLTNVVAIAGAFFHNLALQANGTVVAWGDNTYGQTNVPPDLTNVVAVAGSGYDSLALQANGTVVIWGDNTYGQTNMPPDLTNVMAIAGGGFHSLALRANGTVVAWGDNTYGQTNVPADLTNVVAIAGGGYYSLALQANGTVVAWGDNTYGQTNVPADLTNVVAVAGGYLHSMALENDGSPFIVRQPASQTTSTNTTVTFTVIALGAPALSYQWQKNGSNIIDGGNVSGSTSATLTLTDVQAADAAGYTVVITNAIGSVTSSNAVLTVTNIPLGFIPPSFGNIIAAGGGSFILSGTGGLSNGTYYILMSSNLLVPLTNWTHIATDQFDGTGGFIFTNTAQTNAPQEFYLLQLQ
jgi:alpha-tubulin suppressor-like RCC1 family protein